MSAETNKWLEDFVARHGGAAGTVHHRSGEILELVAAHNIPPKVREITAKIPRGKGMAGLAFERAAPVSSCNIQSDKSGDVRPGARAVDAQAAVALPVKDESGEVRAVVGIAWMDQRDIGEAELAALGRDALDVP